MLSLSIIVPATGRQEELDDTLVSVLENRPKNCEILVPHTDSYQDPYDLGDEVRFVSCQTDTVIDLYNAGIRTSQADVVHLLGSGSKVSAGWTDSPREKFEADADLAAVSPRLQQPSSTTWATGVKYRRGGSRRVVAGRRRRSSPKPIDAPCLHAAFIRSTVFSSLSELDASLDEYYAEVDLAAEMRRARLKCMHDPDSSIVGRLTNRARGFQAARQMERVYWRHASSDGRLTSLLLHLTAVAGEMAPQILSPRLISSGVGHLFGVAECLIRGSELATVDEPTAPEESSTIRLHIPDGDDSEMTEMNSNRRGA